MKSRRTVFISYSHQDERWRARLVQHLGVLAAQGQLEIWDDRQLAAGEDWFERIREQLGTARIAVLLISSAFLTSRFICAEEVPKIFDRHRQDGMIVYPLLVKPCPWQEVAWLARMQIRPRDGRAVASHRAARADEILVEAAREIGSMLREHSCGSGAPMGAGLNEPIDISGEWNADVKYDWPNAHYVEVFKFKVDDGELFGTASFVGSEKAILEGKVMGNKLTFVTRSQECLGTSDPRESVHRYRGKIAGDLIEFMMQSEGGYSEHIPIEFTARRAGRSEIEPHRNRRARS